MCVCVCVCVRVCVSIRKTRLQTSSILLREVFLRTYITHRLVITHFNCIMYRVSHWRFYWIFYILHARKTYCFFDGIFSWDFSFLISLAIPCKIELCIRRYLAKSVFFFFFFFYFSLMYMLGRVCM